MSNRLHPYCLQDGELTGSSAGLDFEELHKMDSTGSGTAYSSPAMPSVFDVNPSASSSMTNVGTVSPQDLLVHEPYMSAPNSTALTALTSPSIYNESPDFNDAFNMSPNLEGGEMDNGSGDTWFPLFPSEVPMGMAGPDQPLNEDSTKSSSAQSTTRPKKRKSGGASPGTPSSGSGVGSRRREKPLPPIIIEDPSDVVAMKRARNTLAARKSRERKAQRLDELEDRISALERERDYWKRLAQENGAA